MLLLSTE